MKDGGEAVPYGICNSFPLYFLSITLYSITPECLNLKSDYLQNMLRDMHSF